jgi:hypothetical protein
MRKNSNSNCSRRPLVRRHALGTACVIVALVVAAQVRAQSTVLLPDPTNNRVLRYNVDAGGNWAIAGVFGSAADGSNMFNPQSVAYDGSNTVYIGESDTTPTTGASRILKYDVNGNYQGVLTMFSTAGERVDKMVFAPDGNLLVSDPFGTGFVSDQIIKVNVSDGSYSTFIAPGDPLFFDPYQLINPRSMAVVGNTLYVTNRNGMGANTGSVVRFNATTGAYIDAGIGADAGAINDDVFFDIDEPNGIVYDSGSNKLYFSALTAGPDVFSVDLSASGAPPLTDASAGVTKILDQSGSNRNFLGMKIVDGQLYTTAFANDALYRIVPDDRSGHRLESHFHFASPHLLPLPLGFHRIGWEYRGRTHHIGRPYWQPANQNIPLVFLTIPQLPSLGRFRGISEWRA